MTSLPLSQADLVKAVEFWLNSEVLKKPVKVTQVNLAGIPGAQEDLAVTVEMEEKE